MFEQRMGFQVLIHQILSYKITMTKAMFLIKITMYQTNLNKKNHRNNLNNPRL